MRSEAVRRENCVSNDRHTSNVDQSYASEEDDMDADGDDVSDDDKDDDDDDDDDDDGSAGDDDDRDRDEGIITTAYRRRAALACRSSHRLRDSVRITQAAARRV